LYTVEFRDSRNEKYSGNQPMNGRRETNGGIILKELTGPLSVRHGRQGFFGNLAPKAE
jgi:hypothetical protein